MVPLLHTNVIKLIGFNDPSNYLAYKLIGDKYIALDKDGGLSTWNLVSGKFLEYHDKEYSWIKDY